MPHSHLVQFLKDDHAQIKVVVGVCPLITTKGKGLYLGSVLLEWSVEGAVLPTSQLWLEFHPPNGRRRKNGQKMIKS